MGVKLAFMPAHDSGPIWPNPRIIARRAAERRQCQRQLSKLISVPGLPLREVTADIKANVLVKDSRCWLELVT